MLKSINGKRPVIHKLVFEARYDHGYAYLDRCGRTINLIQKRDPGWIVTTNVNAQSAILIEAASGIRLSFSSQKLDLSLEQPAGEESLSEDAVKAFADRSADATAIILDQLGIERITRLGFRIWYLFGSASSQESEKWIQGLKCFNICPKIAEAFEGHIEESALTVVLNASDRKYRIMFSGIQRTLPISIGQEVLNVPAHQLPKNQREHLARQARVRKLREQNPEFAAQIDIDAYQEEPKLVDVYDFIFSSFNQGFENLYQAIGRESKR